MMDKVLAARTVYLTKGFISLGNLKWENVEKIINPWEGVEGYSYFGCAPNNGTGVEMKFYEEDDEVTSIWRPRPEYQGWIDTLHGDTQAVLLDGIRAWVVLRKLQTTRVTSKVETHYRKSINTNDLHVVLRTHIKEVKRNIVLTGARLYSKNGELCAGAVCTYFTFPEGRTREKMHFLSCGVEDEEILPLT